MKYTPQIRVHRTLYLLMSSELNSIFQFPRFRCTSINICRKRLQCPYYLKPDSAKPRDPSDVISAMCALQCDRIFLRPRDIDVYIYADINEI